MRRLLTLMAVLAVMVAFTLPVGTASAASHGKVKKEMTSGAAKAKAKEMANPCAAKEVMNPCAKKANPCAKKANPCNPCNPCAKKAGMMDKAKDAAGKVIKKVKPAN